MTQKAPFSSFPNEKLITDFNRQVFLDGHCVSRSDQKVDSCEAGYGIGQILIDPDRFQPFYPLVPILDQIRQGRYRGIPRLEASAAERKVEGLLKGTKSVEPFDLEGETYRPVFMDADSVLNNFLRKYGSSKRVSLGDGTTGTWSYGPILYERPVFFHRGRLVWYMVFRSSATLNQGGLARNVFAGSIFCNLPAFREMITTKVAQRRALERRISPVEKQFGWFKALSHAEKVLGFEGRNIADVTDEELRPFTHVTRYHERQHYDQFEALGELYEGLWHIDTVTGWGELGMLDEALTEIRTLIAALEGNVSGLTPQKALACLIFENAPDPSSGGRYQTFDGYVTMSVVEGGFDPSLSQIDHQRILGAAKKVEAKLAQTVREILAPDGVILRNLKESWGGAPFESVRSRLVERAINDWSTRGVSLRLDEVGPLFLWRSVGQHLLDDEQGRRGKAIHDALQTARTRFEEWLRESIRD